MVRQSCVDVASGGSNYILQRGLRKGVLQKGRGGGERLGAVPKVKVPQGAV